ncbi:hypothetical protein N658DRAFT_283695 [Parathielavia hyrcaniae]|uniref:Uncharacterized protein n=1 Tax=Parathielavia hyrcaniae TaxID=113614 RepID=A0AAN6Q8G7_9PEZI|nr:hypothetical protein N658DRAFT_283695 [Parathielavia hyrcaniae]
MSLITTLSFLSPDSCVPGYRDIGSLGKDAPKQPDSYIGGSEGLCTPTPAKTLTLLGDGWLVTRLIRAESHPYPTAGFCRLMNDRSTIQQPLDHRRCAFGRPVYPNALGLVMLLLSIGGGQSDRLPPG